MRFGWFGNGELTEVGPGVLRLDREGALKKFAGMSFQSPVEPGFGAEGGPAGELVEARGGGGSEAC